MKLLLMKCQICHDWYSPLRNHCPTCAAMPIKISAHCTKHIDNSSVRGPVELKRVISSMFFLEHELEIARELMEGVE